MDLGMIIKNYCIDRSYYNIIFLIVKIAIKFSK